MQARLRQSEWDLVDVSYDHGPSVTYVYRRAHGEREYSPWLVIGQSCMLKRIGIVGLGLYSGRSFKEGDYLGKYDGENLGTFDTREEAMASNVARRRLQRGHDKLVVVRRSSGSGFDLLDGENAGPPHLEMANDPRNIGRLQPNIECTDYGWFRVTSSRIPPFDLEKADNTDSELRWSYGQSYWDFHDTLGSSSQHAIDVD